MPPVHAGKGFKEWSPWGPPSKRWESFRSFEESSSPNSVCLEKDFSDTAWAHPLYLLNHLWGQQYKNLPRLSSWVFSEMQVPCSVLQARLPILPSTGFYVSLGESCEHVNGMPIHLMRSEMDSSHFLDYFLTCMCIQQTIFILHNLGNHWHLNDRSRAWHKVHSQSFLKFSVTGHLDKHQSHIRVVERKIYSVPEFLRQRRR